MKNELVAVDYEAANAGYNSRDIMIQDEFSKLVQCFSVFVALVVAIQAFTQLSPFIKGAITVVLALGGIVAIFSYLVDIQANTSCKAALRKHCNVLESASIAPDALKCWHAIDTRERSWLERLVKGNSIGERSVGGLFVFASWIFLALWSLLSVSMTFVAFR